MLSREEYVQQMKKQIDEWNLKLAAWEADVQKAQSGLKSHYETQIEALRKQRDETMERLSETRNASQAAWMQVSKGFEEAWKTLHSSFDSAWAEYKKKK